MEIWQNRLIVSQSWLLMLCILRNKDEIKIRVEVFWILHDVCIKAVKIV